MEGRAARRCSGRPAGVRSSGRTALDQDDRVAVGIGGTQALAAHRNVHVARLALPASVSAARGVVEARRRSAARRRRARSRSVAVRREARGRSPRRRSAAAPCPARLRRAAEPVEAATSARRPLRRRRPGGSAWWTRAITRGSAAPRRGARPRPPASPARRGGSARSTSGGGADLDSRSRSSSTTVLREPADPLDLDLDQVARLDRPRVGRRPGQQHVAGLERDQPRDVGDLVGEGEDQVVAGVPLLDLLAVDEGADGQVVGVDVGGVDDERARAGRSRPGP